MEKFSKLIFVLLVALLAACSPQKRLARLVNNHPELIQSQEVRFDTVFITQPVQFDTVIDLRKVFVFDTIREKVPVKQWVIQKGGLSTTLLLTADSLLKVLSQYKGDSIKVDLTKEVPLIAPPAPEKTWLYYLGAFFSKFWAILLLIVFVVWLYKTK